MWPSLNKVKNKSVRYNKLGHKTTCTWRTSRVTYVTMVPRVGNETLHPLGVAMGNAVSVTRVWSIHTKTQLVGRRQPMTSLLARPQYKRALCSIWSQFQNCVRMTAERKPVCSHRPSERLRRTWNSIVSSSRYSSFVLVRQWHKT